MDRINWSQFTRVSGVGIWTLDIEQAYLARNSHPHRHAVTVGVGNTEEARPSLSHRGIELIQKMQEQHPSGIHNETIASLILFTAEAVS